MRYLRGLAIALLAVLTIAGLSSTAIAQDNAAEAHKIPAINAGLGHCSVELDIRDSSQKPVYAAKVTVRIAYGFLGLHKLDLEAATNIDGKVRFSALPSKTKFPLEFRAVKDDKEGIAVVELSQECNSTHTVVLQKKPSNETP
jgi:hypothetical protein